MGFEKTMKQVERLMKRGASDKVIKPKDYDHKISSLENPAEMVQTILGRLKMAAEFRDPWEEEWRRAFMAWMQRLDTVMEDSWESKRYVPMILKHVETALPAIIATVFNGPNLWTMHGTTPAGRDAADALDDLCHWQAKGPSRLQPEFDKVAFYSILFGTGFMDVSWSEKVEVRLVPKVVQDEDEYGNPLYEEGTSTPKPIKVLREEETTIEDWPVFRAISPLDVWPAPYSEVGDEGEWFIIGQDTTLNKLRQTAGNGHIDADALEAWAESYYPKDGGFSLNTADQSLFESANPDLWNEWLNDLGYEDRDDQTAEDRLDGDKTIKILIYRSKTETVTIAPDKVIIGYSDNPYIHGRTGIINHQFINLPESPFGRGLGTILLSHQELANENINLFMDTSKISLMAPVVVNKSNVSTLDRNFVWAPNVLIHSRDINNAAKRLDVPAPTDLAMHFDQTLNRDADEITGFSEQARGQSPSGVNTATEFSGLQANIATRSFMHVRRLRDFMSMIGRAMVSLNQQFMTKEQVVTILGENGLDYRTVEPWEIVGETEVVALAATSRANPSMRAQQMLQATQLVMPVLQSGKAPPAMMRWMRILLETIEIEDVDRLIPKNFGKVRDPLMENIALKNGVLIKPSEFENHKQHIDAHSKELAELQQTGGIDSFSMEKFLEHIQAHTAMAEQQAEEKEEKETEKKMIERGAPERQEAQQLGAAQGSNGVPGAASPGPGAPAGRPM